MIEVVGRSIPSMKYFPIIFIDNYLVDVGAILAPESLGVVGVDSGTWPILDSSAFTNFICELVGGSRSLGWRLYCYSAIKDIFI